MKTHEALMFVDAHPELLEAANKYIELANKAGTDPKALLLGLPLRVPQAAYFMQQGYREGYAAAQEDFKRALQDRLECIKAEQEDMQRTARTTRGPYG